ncbi:MAG: TIGR03435 family protein, partial [Acidobacteriota bacterium]|nr:TIGR03435 family protein [Acidobacteriota bacterium]
LVWVAYMPALETGKVEGGPKWADSVQWDIEAKVDDAQMAGWDKLTDTQRMDRIKPMMRALLVERFELKVHEETRVTPVYALVQAKGGVKMKLVDAPPANADPQEQEARARDPKAQNKPPVGGFRVSDAGWVGNAVTIRGLLGQIAYEAGYGDRVMIDATGLDGHYDFAIKLSKDKDGPTPGQQIEDQLGLKVESRKVPIKIYVIDSAEKPSEN